MTGLCVMPFTYYEFQENQYNKAYRSLHGINECLSVLLTFAIRCENFATDSVKQL